MERRPLETLLPDAARMVALAGAGGKTTLMYALAARLAARGRRVVCTTTTKIYLPERLPVFLLEGDAARATAQRKACESALAAGICVVAETMLLNDHKLVGLTPRRLSECAEALPDAVFLVEADGAAGKPLKAPSEHEPVWPEAPDCCIGVMGLDSSGQPLDEAHVHRAGLCSAVCGQAFGTLVTPLTLARLAEHDEGLFRSCPPGHRIVFANKADLPGALAAARAAAALSRSLSWVAGSAQQGWWMPLA